MRFMLCLLIAFAPVCAAAQLPFKAQQTPNTEKIDQQLKSLKLLRDKEKKLLQEAQRDADRYLSRDWLLYRRAVLRQQYLEKRIQEIDEQIAKLEKR